MPEKQETGITVSKEKDISEWYTQVLQKAELIEYSDVSGCYILRPRAYYIWEQIQTYLDQKFKKTGVKNTSFPLLIPENLLKKEAEHVQGFSPEVAWVTQTGETKLNERLAIRPTSETIMYAAYAKWIRSHKDLPLMLNQWCSVVRWEFSHPTPLLRSREFLWQEGHSAFTTKKEADKEARERLETYYDCYKEILAVPTLKGNKSEKEKFAGADYSLSLEAFLPSGKAIQACTSHHLGQHFSKPFDIGYLNQEGKRELVYQNSWGFTTRSVGTMILIHSDDKGLVLPPAVAENKAVIVPILFDQTKEKVLKKCFELEKTLKNFHVFVDDRMEYTPGWKYNEWELKGIPLRIELGPKDLEKNQVVLVRRDTGKKEFIQIKDVKKKVEETLELMQQELFTKAEKFLQDNIQTVEKFSDFEKALKNKKIILAPWCCGKECETLIKDKTEGAKSLTIPFENKVSGKRCFHCGKEAKSEAYFGRSY